jgi:hypothetical protein
MTTFTFDNSDNLVVSADTIGATYILGNGAGDLVHIGPWPAGVPPHQRHSHPR